MKNPKLGERCRLRGFCFKGTIDLANPDKKEVHIKWDAFCDKMAIPADWHPESLIRLTKRVPLEFWGVVDNKRKVAVSPSEKLAVKDAKDWDKATVEDAPHRVVLFREGTAMIDDFKVGDEVKIVNCLKSFSARMFLGRVGKITAIKGDSLVGERYVLLDFPEQQFGIWISEIEHVASTAHVHTWKLYDGFTDKFEYCTDTACNQKRSAL